MNEGRKPLLVLAFPPPYHGVTVMNAQLLAGLKRTRTAYEIIDISDHRSIENIGRLDLVNVWKAMSSLFLMARLMLIRRPSRLYLALSQNRLGFFRDALFIAVASVCRSEVIVHLHGSDLLGLYYRAPRLYQFFMNVTLKSVRKGVVLSEKFKPQLDRWIKDVVVVPNGIDFDGSNTDGSVVCPSQNEQSIKVLFLSNLFRAKGIYDFLSAAMDISRTSGAVQFVVAGSFGRDPETGEGPDAVEQQIQIAKREMGGSLQFAGPVWGDEKTQLLRDADVFVFASRMNEGQPLTVIESMAAGVPVIGTRVGALEEMIAGNDCGIVIEPGDVESLKNAITLLIKDEQRRKELARHSRLAYERHFTAETFVSRMRDAIYSGDS